MIGRNLPHPPPNQQWHDIYDHCHNCKQVHVKNEMVEIATNKRLCVECATKHVVDLNSREGYLVKLINRAYNCKEWCECLDTLEPVVKEKESNDAK